MMSNAMQIHVQESEKKTEPKYLRNKILGAFFRCLESEYFCNYFLVSETLRILV